MPSDSYWSKIYYTEAMAERCCTIADRDTFRVTHDDTDDIFGAAEALERLYPPDGITRRAEPCAMEILARQCKVLTEGESVPFVPAAHRGWLKDAALEILRLAQQMRYYAAERAEKDH